MATLSAAARAERLGRPRTVARATPFTSFAAGLRKAADLSTETKGATWPSERYRRDPVGFARDVLGFTPWSKQVEIAEALANGAHRVAVSSGHKIGKSSGAAWISLWFFESFTDARVIFTAPTARQVDQILWRELSRMHSRARMPLDGTPGKLARTGLKSYDFREIVGFTARDVEAVAGISGANVLYVVDEASGVDDAIFDAIKGNLAGGGYLLLLGNPTRTEGEHYEAFDSKREIYRTFRVSSEETPNVVEGRVVVPGLATREWVEEMRLEYGEDSPFYKIRVRGEHVLGEDGKIISAAALIESAERWEDTPADGRLQIGLDPAGPGLAGDESVFAVRRGQKLLALLPFRGLTEEAHLAHLLGILAANRQPREPIPLVCVDRDGPIGSAVYGTLRAFINAPENANAFELAGIRSSDKAHRRPDLYDRTRDELWANLKDWIGAGGAIVDDAKLEKELHAPDWIPQVGGRLKVTPKTELRQKLERSPDRADALALAVWVPHAYREPTLQASTAPTPDDPPPTHFNPYAGLAAWGPDR